MNRIKSSASRIWQASAVALGLSAMTIIVGCGDDSGIPARYPIKGKVTYNGAPVAHGTVNFLPTKPPPEGRAATGEIKDGYYSLTTVGDFDGALPGDYKVAIVALDMDLASAAASKEQGGMVHQGDAGHQKAVKSAKALIPSKYGTGETSGLKATVETSGKTIDFDLKD